MSQRIVLIRHGRTDEKFKNCYIGSTDISLSLEGKKQIEDSSKELQYTDKSLVMVSPLKRALQSAEIFKKVTRLNYQIENNLAEIDFGDWEGLTFDKIQKQDKEVIKKWAEMDEVFAFPNGECVKAFHDRVIDVAERIKRTPARHIFIISHGGVIGTLVCYFLGLPFQKSFVFNIPQGSHITLDIPNS